MNSVYFAVLTMITVGIINTNNTVEQFISIFVVLMLSGVFAYSINTIGIILKDINESSNELKLKVNDIMYYMVQRKISPNLQNRFK